MSSRAWVIARAGFVAITVLFVLGLGSAPVGANTGQPPFVNVVFAGGSGTVSDDRGNSCSSTCKLGYGVPGVAPPAAVKFSASPASGFVLQGWGGECSGSGSCTISLDPNVPSHDVSVTFEERRPRLVVSVTGPGRVTSSPAGIDCGGSCTATFGSGTQVTLTAAPDEGARFGGWGGDCAASSPSTACLLTMSQDHAASASFAALPVNARYAPPKPGAALDRLVFDARSTTAAATVATYAWDFAGDGNFDASCPGSDPVAFHAFDRAGTYNVGLRVTDVNGETSTVTHTISVGGPDGLPIHAPARVQPSPRAGVACGHASTRDRTGLCVDTVQTGLITASTISTCFEEGTLEGTTGEFVPADENATAA